MSKHPFTFWRWFRDLFHPIRQADVAKEITIVFSPYDVIIGKGKRIPQKESKD